MRVALITGGTTAATLHACDTGFIRSQIGDVPCESRNAGGVR